MPDVFISFARSTAASARMIRDAFQDLGYEVWSDDQLPPHKSYADVIEEKLRAAKAVVVLWSSDAVRSQWVRAEADLARGLGTLVQLRIDDALPPLPFNQIQCADLAGWRAGAHSDAWNQVLAAVAELVASEGHAEPASGSGARTPGSSGRPARSRVQVALTVGGALALLALSGWVIFAAYETQRSISRTTPETLRAALSSYAGSAHCAWLTAEPARGPNGMTLRLGGLAGDPPAVEQQVRTLIKAAGLSADVDASDLNRVGPQACGALDTLLRFRESPPGSSMAVPRGEFGLNGHAAGCDRQAGVQANPLTVITVLPPADFTLLGMESNGRLQQVVADRADFMADVKSNPALFAVQNGSLVLRLCVDKQTWSRTPLLIEVLVKGQGPFNLDPLNVKQEDAVFVDQDWQDRFWANARANGWTTELVWFRVQK
jgi:hypothetical protein